MQMPDFPPHLALLQMITGRWVSQAITAAAKLRLADQLRDGPRTIAELAAATKSHPPSLYRLLRALASVGIFAEIGDGTGTDVTASRFDLTPLADALRSDAPVSMRGVALWLGEECCARAWANLDRSVQTGETAFDCVFGQNGFEYLLKHPATLEAFHLAMEGFTAASLGAIIAAYDFSGIKTLLDVGGSSGSLLAAILKANQSLRGILYDREEALAGAAPILAAAGVADRCAIVAGDFFQRVPPGAGACILKHVLHNWNDERAAAILANCRRALPAGGKVLVVDAVIVPGNDPAFGKLLDLEMLAIASGGRERGECEFRKLFAAAGLRLARLIPTPAPFVILEGVPA